MELSLARIPFDEAAVCKSIIEANESTAGYGLTLDPEQALDVSRIYRSAIADNQIVEFGAGGLIKIQKAFAASDFVDRSNYCEVVEAMTESFYYLKREVDPEVRDDTVISAMLEAFDKKSMGSIELFQGRELETLIKYLNEGRTSLEITGDEDYDSEPEVPVD